MTRGVTSIPLALALALTVTPDSHARSEQDGVYDDQAGDAVIRRTDPGNDGALHPQSVLPDLLSVTTSGWMPFSPATDPYAGQVVASDGADIFRMQLTLNGLVNPPGPLGLGSTGFEPFRYGPSPLFGFVECDLDSRSDTGGELGASATLRYFANVARFGEVPEGSDSSLAAVSGDDLDLNFFSGPFYERSGQDYSLNLCGCYDVSVVNTFGDADNTFDAGDAWIVRGRFWQRAGGYEEASAAFGGSFFGLYDPFVDLLFSHDAQSDTTTVTLVEAVTNAGAAMLAGQGVQPLDLSVLNHTSVEEAITDIAFGAGDPFLSAEARTLVEEWDERPVEDALEPDQWRVNAIVGTSYLFAEESLYVWTDALGEHEANDLNADSFVNQLDVDAFDAQVTALDGSPFDADGMPDGDVLISNFGENFHLLDFDADGEIDAQDRALILGVLPGDCDGSGGINFSDLVCMLAQFGPGTGAADCDGSGTVDFADLVCALSLFD